MDKRQTKQLIEEQLKILDSAASVLKESYDRVSVVLSKKKLAVDERESCEALTARFSRLCDYLFQRAFRTLDKIELLDEGTAIDRLNRMEKRKIIESAEKWRELRELRNDIAHEYLIEQSDRVLVEAHRETPVLIETVKRWKQYVTEKGYL